MLLEAVKSRNMFQIIRVSGSDIRCDQWIQIAQVFGRCRVLDLQFGGEESLSVPQTLQAFGANIRAEHSHQDIILYGFPFTRFCSETEGAMIRDFFATKCCTTNLRICSTDGRSTGAAVESGEGEDCALSFLLEGLSVMRHVPERLTMKFSIEDLRVLGPEKLDRCWRRVERKDELRNKIFAEQLMERGPNILDETASDMGIRHWCVTSLVMRNPKPFCRWLEASSIQQLTIKDWRGTQNGRFGVVDFFQHLQQVLTAHPTIVGVEYESPYAQLSRVATGAWLRMISFKQIRHVRIHVMSLDDDGLLELTDVVQNLDRLQSFDIRVNNLSPMGADLLKNGFFKSLSLVNVTVTHAADELVARIQALQEFGSRIARRNKNLNRLKALLRSSVSSGLWSFVLSRFVASPNDLVDPLFVGLRENAGFASMR